MCSKKCNVHRHTVVTTVARFANADAKTYHVTNQVRVSQYLWMCECMVFRVSVRIRVRVG